MKNYFAIVMACFLISCEKKELPRAKYDRGEGISSQVSMASDYRNQIWFSLSENKVTASNLKTDWDIALECSAEGYRVILNTSKAMRAFKTSYADISQAKDTAGLGANGRSDVPNGNTDSTAIGNWVEDNRVFVINRGYSETGDHQGYCRLKMLEVTGGSYKLEYGALGGPVFTREIFKNRNYNFIAFSFSTGKSVTIEPAKNAYDLCFTQYTHVFYNPFQYYQVTGVLINPSHTRVAKLKGTDFSKISLADTIRSTFSNRRDAIGYDWKDFDLNTNIFTVNLNMCYIIQDNRGFFYKLHFMDFYDSKGIKGAPKFEFKKL